MTTQQLMNVIIGIGVLIIVFNGITLYFNLKTSRLNRQTIENLERIKKNIQ